MPREIKFIGYYRPRNGFCSEIGDGTEETAVNGVNKTIKSYQDDPNWEVLQYIGKKDINGSEIYEDYILSCPFINHGSGSRIKTKNILCQVVWNDLDHIYLKNLEPLGNFRFYPDYEDCIIVGNIYQHPHLLKNEQKP